MCVTSGTDFANSSRIRANSREFVFIHGRTLANSSRIRAESMRIYGDCGVTVQNRRSGFSSTPLLGDAVTTESSRKSRREPDVEAGRSVRKIGDGDVRRE